MYIPSLASCLLLTLANANGSLASTYSNSTLASLDTANTYANSCFDTTTCNIDDDDEEDETGSVQYITMASYPLTNRKNTLIQSKSQLNILRLRLPTTTIITSKLAHPSEIA